nr:MAG TPA: hypothetical protein [Caudoviricetes sp.]
MLNKSISSFVIILYESPFIRFTKSTTSLAFLISYNPLTLGYIHPATDVGVLSLKPDIPPTVVFKPNPALDPPFASALHSLNALCITSGDKYLSGLTLFDIFL